MAAESEFVFDAVIGFLTSPIWHSPVITFIEDNCIVFEPDEIKSETYKEIHKKYKDMIEGLLSSFVQDIGISLEQFTAACRGERGGNAQFNEIRKNVLEQMMAAEDYEVFLRLMIQKNIELQLQALQLIQQQTNNTSTLSEPVQQRPDDEDEIFKEVLRLSKEEYDKKTQKEKKEDDDFKKTLTESFQENERLKMLAQREQEQLNKALKAREIKDSRPEAKADHKEHEVLLKTSDKVPEKATTSSTKDRKSQEPLPCLQTSSASPSGTPPAAKTPNPQEIKIKNADLPPLPGIKKSNTPADAAANWLNDAKSEVSASTVSTKQVTEISEDEVKRRTEYLKQQRDKLLQMKKQQREKNLIKFKEEQPKARPMSARAARRVTAGEEPSPDAAAVSVPDDTTLAMRRALADVLKREVIEKQ